MGVLGYSMARKPSEIRELIPENAKMVTNQLPSDKKAEKAVIWVENPINFPSWVEIKAKYKASGKAPAISNFDIEGWWKYEIEF